MVRRVVPSPEFTPLLKFLFAFSFLFLHSPGKNIYVYIYIYIFFSQGSPFFPAKIRFRRLFWGFSWLSAWGFSASHPPKSAGSEPNPSKPLRVCQRCPHGCRCSALGMLGFPHQCLSKPMQVNAHSCIICHIAKTYLAMALSQLFYCYFLTNLGKGSIKDTSCNHLKHVAFPPT